MYYVKIKKYRTAFCTLLANYETTLLGYKKLLELLFMIVKVENFV